MVTGKVPYSQEGVKEEGVEDLEGDAEAEIVVEVGKRDKRKKEATTTSRGQ